MKDRYHHGDLERELLRAAVEIIREEGVDALTLRGVGARVGVSRTAPYRHFTDKAALLARVAAEGFAMLRDALRGADDLEEMAVAYVDFALANQSHYRVMFGRSHAEWCEHAELMADGGSAFQCLVDAVVAGQQAGRIVADDPLRQAHVLWAAVHGIAMLTLDGQLDSAGLTRYTARCLRDGLAPVRAMGAV